MTNNQDKQLTIAQIYAKGKENLKNIGVEWVYPPGGKTGPAVRSNRKYLDSLFFETHFFDPIEVDTSFTIFNQRLRTPVFCSAISRMPYMSQDNIAEIARGLASAGSFITLGIGSSSELQSAIDTGVPVVKMVKPYRDTNKIYKKVRDAENRGCVAVGMDIDHFYGAWIQDRVLMSDLFSPQNTEELKQLVSQTKLPFIIKGVLSVSDAEKALEIGASTIVVSNHGSGSLDFGLPSMIALPKIADAVGKQMSVLVDTGFETGSDIFKGLAFGANAVGLASPIVLAWSADGSKGVEALINQITEELRRNMAAASFPNLSSIDRASFIEVPTADQ